MKNFSELKARRLDAQLLSGPPARSPETVVERLLVVQAQDGRGARLTVRSRSTGLRAADVDDALTGRRSVVVAWLNRGTLHLVGVDDFWWLHPITNPQIAVANRRRLLQGGVSDAQARRGVDTLIDAVTANGPQTRAELREQLQRARVPTDEQAFIHVLFAASLTGEIVRGPLLGSEHAFVSTREWLGAPPAALDRPEALARLARRYLAGHGPAEARDLARWAKLTLGDARAAFESIRDELAERADGLVDLADRMPAAPPPQPLLLGPFDPLLLGWVSRAPFVGTQPVVTNNGIFRPFALVDGRVVAIWKLSGNTLTVQPLEKLKATTVKALRGEAADVLRFLDRSADTEVVVES